MPEPQRGALHAGRRPRITRVTIILTTALLAVVFFFATGPTAPRATAPATAAGAGRTVRGAFHIHTTRSDGALDKRAIAAAAARAGLSFAIFTDHGDATRATDPPAYIDGVLCIDAVEISTKGGHYVALGLPPAPYPLGGEADTVAEDVARLGGFGVAAHPFSARPELAWSDWAVPIDGLEWLNADSEWRDESRLRLTRAVFDYLWRPGGALASLLDRPVAALARWDQIASTRRVVGLAAHDAHGGFGTEVNGGRGRRLHIPSYDASFRTFSLYVTMPNSAAEVSADLEADVLIGAIRSGSVFTAVDAVATPPSLDFRATAGDLVVRMGEALPVEAGPARFTIRAAVPVGATTMLLRDGRAVAESNRGELDHDASLPGVYRVEIYVAGAPGAPPVPWLVSNPIYRWKRTTDAPPAPQAIADRMSLASNVWKVESSPHSSALMAGGEPVRLQFQLRPDVRASQFVALVSDLTNVPEDADVLAFSGSASRPMRVSAQLRFGSESDVRWGRSIYLEPSEREVRIPMDSLRPEGAAATRPPLAQASSLLFVVDLTNAAPGATGEFAIRDVRFARSAVRNP
jgi:hypothetical protein